jgi:16S rRNA (guanine1516-N2)-methyltransferase
VAAERLQLIHASSLTALTDITPRPQVVYLDPMFPHKQKSALVKKRCACFSRWWGRIWMPTACWSQRVSWRPNGGGETSGLCRRWRMSMPNAVVTKGHRFDIYAGTPESRW